jgi:cobalt-zinc-cadmium efflux system protein
MLPAGDDRTLEVMAGHTHSHAEHLPGSALRTAFVLTIVILVIEAVVGYVANSLALMSDAGHILTDAIALGLAWFAIRLADQPASKSNTFGYRRSGILVALGNSTALIAVAVVVTVEAVLRLRHPEHLQGGLVIVAALGALAVNTYIALALRGDSQENLNVRAALLHVLGDIGASLGVVVAGAAALLWQAYILDPLLSLCIAALIALGAWQIVRDTVVILMEGTPRGVDLDVLEAAMKEVPGVEGVHDLHVWSLADGYFLLSAHVMVPDQSVSDVANLLSDLKTLLHRRFHIEHATIETECIDCRVPPRRPILLDVGRPGARS